MAKSFASSSVYNPNRTPDVLALYEIMQSRGNDADVLARYRAQVENMSTASPYRGVLNNPRQCEVDQATTTLDEVLENLIVTPNVPPVVEDTLEDIKDKLEEYKEHTEKLIANFPTIASIVQQQIGNAVGKLGSNPCLSFGDMMGSVLQEGQDIMGEILGAIADVEANIDDVEALIEEAIPKLEAAIAKALTQKEEEVTKLAESMMNSAQMNLAGLLKIQVEDPCLSQIMSSIMTPEAEAALDEGKDTV